MHHDALLDPVVRWPQRSQRMVFVNSMSDLFHARVSTEFIAKAQLGTYAGGRPWSDSPDPISTFIKFRRMACEQK